MNGVVMLLLAVRVEAAPIVERVREACTTEISMFCSGRKDLTACLREQGSSLTAKCVDELSGKAASPTTTVGKTSQAKTLSAVGPPPGATPVRGAANVWIEGGYSGPKPELLPQFTAAIAAEIPGALEIIAKRVGQPGYASGFARPLMIHIEYDPTQQRGLGSLDDSGDEAGRWRLNFNMAHWEDCPSPSILRSVVTHELTHAVLHDLLNGGQASFVPQWFDEGLAMLVGGEPSRSIALDAAYARHGKDYPGAVHCPFDNEGFGLSGGGLLTECYPFYLLAVEELAESSPGALPGIITDLRAGVPIENAVPARAALAWGSFVGATVERAHRVVGGKSALSLVTGKNWWRQVRWCRGS